MTKKTVTLLLVLLIVFLAGCGNNSTERNHSTSQSSQMELTEQYPETVQSTEKPAEATTEFQKVSINWTNLTFTQEDMDGYRYRITYKFSPWILLSNTNAIHSAWEEIGALKMLPTFTDWGLKQSGEGYYRNGVSCIHRGGSETGNFGPFEISDMYYCFGTITIDNNTDGWDITPETSKSVKTYLDWALDDSTKYKWTSIGRVYYSNNTQDELDGLCINTILSGNSMSASFVIMAPESYTPNDPNGKYYDKMINGRLYGSSSGQRIKEQSVSLTVLGNNE